MQYLDGSVKAVFKARMAIPKETARSKKRYLTSFSAIVNDLLKWLTTDENNAIVDVNIRSLKQNSLTVTDYVLRLRKRTLGGGCVYNEKVLNGLFFEGVYFFICQILRQRWSEKQHAALETLHKKKSLFPTIKESNQEATAGDR